MLPLSFSPSLRMPQANITRLYSRLFNPMHCGVPLQLDMESLLYRSLPVFEEHLRANDDIACCMSVVD